VLTIQDITNACNGKIDILDLELILSRAINKSREFVLAHPDFSLSEKQKAITNKFIKRRIKGEPIAYILGEKEFYGLNFKVNKDVLIPRPETEILVEEALKYLKTIKQFNNLTILDIGTGSGNAIVSIARNTEHITHNVQFLAIDKSKKALEVAKCNAKKHRLDKKIKFLEGDILNPIIKNKKYIIHNTKYIILANLPYVSSQNYKKYYEQIKFEPKSALLSNYKGLDHCENLFKQIKKLILTVRCSLITVLLEFSPEQINKINKLVKLYFPSAKSEFKKDLAGKWRVCKITI
jgi:release factor glutamine methyltransferase